MAKRKNGHRHWVYKCNLAYGGTWRTFFGRGPRASAWGGSGPPGIEGKTSLKILKELMHVDDFVMAYQTDERSILGTCRVAELARTPSKIEMYLEPVENFVDSPVPIHELKKRSAALQNVQALRRAGGETLYGVSPQEWRLLITCCHRYLRTEASSLAAPPAPGGGAGFGDTKNNKLVENAAIKEAKRFYRDDGWEVEDVANENRGYDLRCINPARPEQQQHVEVKGVKGSHPSFIITRREKNYAARSPHSWICVVTDAMSESPKLKRMRGKQFLREYIFDPKDYFAAPGKF
jgi:hypothetical protein